MDRTVVVMNWMAAILILPAMILLTWKLISDRRRGQGISSEMISTALLLVITLIGIIRMNVGTNWFGVSLLITQLGLTIYLFKRLWSPLKQLLRG